MNLAYFKGDGGRNFGDLLAPYIFEKLTGKSATHCDPHSPFDGERFYTVGSILPTLSPLDHVWGSGFMWSPDRLQSPHKIHSVRGPLSREVFLSHGVNCPEVYGDPALILPLIYNPEIPKRYKIGIVPHYVDKKHPALDRFRDREDVLILDIFSSTEDFVDDVLACDVIYSSSLHGVICGDAYGVPSFRLPLSNKVWGADFKFTDYFLSVGRSSVSVSPLGDLDSAPFEYEPEIDREAIMQACPFTP